IFRSSTTAQGLRSKIGQPHALHHSRLRFRRTPKSRKEWRNQPRKSNKNNLPRSLATQTAPTQRKRLRQYIQHSKRPRRKPLTPVATLLGQQPKAIARQTKRISSPSPP